MPSQRGHTANKQFHAKTHSMSDKLQFVDAPKESGFAGNDKLKFIGHRMRLLCVKILAEKKTKFCPLVS